MSGHTPGSWHACRTGILAGSYWVVGNAEIPIENPADRSLIAAGPDLLEACRCEADDCMDGDLLCYVAVHLDSIADDIEKNRPNSANIALYRKWAGKLLKKQALQAAAIAKADGE